MCIAYPIDGATGDMLRDGASIENTHPRFIRMALVIRARAS
jgi:hypothetical protein